MPMPATIPNWNTGGANRTEPSAGKKVLGWVVGEPVDSSFFNWWMFTVYEWVLWLSGIEGEELHWSVAQFFEDGAQFEGADAGDSAIVAIANPTGPFFAPAIVSQGTISIDMTGYVGEAFTITTTGIGVFVTATEGNYFQSSSDDYAAIAVSATGQAPALTSFATEVALAIMGGTGGSVGNQYAAQFENNEGAGAAIFWGGTEANAIGAYFEGATGIASPGYGAKFQGGNPTIGTGKAGILSTGGSNAPGGQFIAGNGASGAGIDSTGSYGVTTGGPGAILRNGLDTVGVALDNRGSISFVNATAPAYNVSIPQQLTRNSFAKAWVLIECNGTANPTILAGMNVTSVTQSIAGGTNGEITINLATNMGTSSSYAVIPLFQNVYGGDRPLVYPKSKTAGAVVLEGQTTAGVVMNAAAWSNGTSIMRQLYVEFMGA